MEKDFTSTKQLQLLSERIKMGLSTDASNELKEYLYKLFKKDNSKPMQILITGAGGSYPVAIFAQYIMNDFFTTPYIDSMTPQSAISKLTKFDNLDSENHAKYDFVMGISYSGKTNDIYAVYEVCKSKNLPFILLTGADKSSLEQLYPEDKNIKIISYYNPDDKSGVEKGMISMASTLVPISVLADLNSNFLLMDNTLYLNNPAKFLLQLDINKIATSIAKHPAIHVFYENDTLATAADIESKFTESGIANVILHEKKNFSHGRYVSLLKQDFSVIINLIKLRCDHNLYKNFLDSSPFYMTKYDHMLDNFLSNICKEKDANYITFESQSTLTSPWNLETLMKIPYLLVEIGKDLDIDVSKPLKKHPEDVISLYNYKGLF